MVIVGEPPSIGSLFIFNLMMFMVGVVDFIDPTLYIGVSIFFIAGIGYTLHYILYWNRKPKTMILLVLSGLMITIGGGNKA